MRSWNGYNNVGLCATALDSVLELTGRLSLAKAMLVMPIVMHDATINFLSRSTVRNREAAALTSTRPEFFSNFSSRYDDSLVLTLNAVQILIYLGHAQLDVDLLHVKPIGVSEQFGERVKKIVRATPKIVALLQSPVEELYLNFRIKL